MKKELNPDRKAEGTFISFLRKLVKKGKGYIIVSNPKEVNHLDKTFKVYDNIASIFTDNSKEKYSTSSILRDLDKPEELKHNQNL